MNHAHILLCQKSGGFNSFLSYLIPESLETICKVGCFVEVPLRKKRVRGLVVKIENGNLPSGFTLKAIEKVWTEAAMPPLHITLAFEIAQYYHSSPGKVLKMMIPKKVWEGSFKIPKKTVYSFLKSGQELKGKNQQKIIECLKINRRAFSKEELMEVVGKVSQTTLSTLVSKGYIKKEEQMLSHEKTKIDPEKQMEHQLTFNQAEALKAIQDADRPILIHGITGSGKTELYLRTILKSIHEGKQALLIVPEIALTPQMIDYFKSHVKNLALFHSKLSDGERALNWYKVQSKQAELVIGSRSALFAPAKQWGCIVMDEEHEWTYKQESSPYYESHFIVEYLQKVMQSKAILGSATPCLESFYKSTQGEYKYVHLPERIGKKPLPELQIVDLREEFKARHFSMFSRALLKAMQDTLSKKGQIILFVNQRGAARAVVCRDCGYTATCKHCEVRLTFHRHFQEEKLICHYCGQNYPMLPQCPECQSIYIKHIGVGTQGVEEECKRYFPEFKVLRADQDTTRLKDGFLNLYQSFKNKEAQILVGTQMIAKGLHFEGVDLIGLILADIGLNIPDFRSHERAFQLVTQVSGRSGRGATAGKVILQTYQPGHFVFQQAKQMDYVHFAEKELELRQKHGYPPFGQLIKFIVVGQDANRLMQDLQRQKKQMEECIARYQLNLKVSLAPAMIPKVSDQYYFHLLLQGQKPHKLFDYWQVPTGWRVDVDPVHSS